MLGDYLLLNKSLDLVKCLICSPETNCFIKRPDQNTTRSEYANLISSHFNNSKKHSPELVGAHKNVGISVTSVIEMFKLHYRDLDQDCKPFFEMRDTVLYGITEFEARTVSSKCLNSNCTFTTTGGKNAFGRIESHILKEHWGKLIELRNELSCLHNDIRNNERCSVSSMVSDINPSVTSFVSKYFNESSNMDV